MPPSKQSFNPPNIHSALSHLQEQKMQASILARTPLAVTETHHYSHGLYSVWPKVYFQDTLGRIRTVDGTSGGASSIAVEKANLNNAFAAISWGGPETFIQPEVSP